MRRRRPALAAVTLALVALALVLAACSGDDDEQATTSPAPRGGVEAPGEQATPPGAARSLPPEFRRCMAERGFEIESQAEIHSAPPEVLQACFGSSHQSGGAP